MQHIKKKTNVANVQQEPKRPAPVSQPSNPQPTQAKPVEQPQQPKPIISQQVDKPKQNLMADILSGKVTLPQASVPQQPIIKQVEPEPKTVQPQENTKKLISNSDRYQALSEENPLLEKLRKQFNLNFN